MIVECDNCHKKYKVADDKIPFEGRKIKCPSCQSVFFVSKPVFSESPSASSDSKPLFSDGQSVFSDDKPITVVKEEEKKPAESKAECPKCGSTNIMGDECLNCGIFISKYVKKQQDFGGEEESQKSFKSPTDYYTHAPDEAPLLDSKPSQILRPDTPIIQSRQAIIAAAVLFFINSGLNLYGAQFEPGSAGTIIVPSIVDIVVAIGLLMSKKSFRNWALIRVVLGMIVWGGVALYQSDTSLFFAQVLVSTAFIVLLTGSGSKARIATGIGIYLVAVVFIVLVGPEAEMEMLRENVVPATKLTIESEQYPYSITMPSFSWKLLKPNTLNEVSDIEMFIEEPEAYCITIVEPIYGYSLQSFKSAIIQNMKDAVNLTVVEEKETYLGTYKAVEMVHTARIQRMDFKYFHIVTAGKSYGYQILCWSFPEDYYQSVNDFKQIANSFKIQRSFGRR